MSAIPKTWLPSYDRLLGTKPDKELAADLGIAVTRVATRRRKLRIRLYRAVDETAQPKTKKSRYRPNRKQYRTLKTSIVRPYAHLIGTMTDCALAAMIGCARQTVNAYRRVMKIPRLADNVKTELTKRLGTEPDTVLADRFGVTATMVSKLRRGLNIRPCSQPVQRRTLPYVLEVAKRLEQAASPDKPGFSIAELSIAVGRDKKVFMSAFYKWHATGCFERIGQFGEAGRCSEYRWKTTGSGLPVRVIEFDISLLGTMSDHDAARKLGNVSVSRIWHVRKRLGIPSWQRQKKRAKMGKNAKVDRIECAQQEQGATA